MLIISVKYNLLLSSYAWYSQLPSFHGHNKQEAMSSDFEDEDPEMEEDDGFRYYADEEDDESYMMPRYYPPPR